MGRSKRADQLLDDAFEADPTLSNVTPEIVDATDTAVELATAPNPDVAAHEPDDDPLTVLQRSYDTLKAEADKHRLDAATAREQATQAARAADGYRMQAEQTGLEAKQASIAAIDSSTAHAKNNIIALKAEIARSAAAQEWDTFAEAQEALAQNITFLQQLSDNRAAAENRRPAALPVSPSPENDRVEQFIRTLTPRSQKWLRAHQSDVFSSSTKRTKAEAAHNMAVADGFEPDSDAYFTELDRYMGYSAPESKSATTAHQRQTGPVASAPPARSNPAQPMRSDQVRLTKEQQDTAIAIFSDKKREDAIALYAASLRELKSGKTNLMLSTDKYRGGYNGI